MTLSTVPDSASARTHETSRNKRLSCTGQLKTSAQVVLHHLRKHTGTGIVCAVAYFDPGNWSVDLAAGSQFGYRLLFVVLLAGTFAIFLQVLCSRLGCVTGLDLASHVRLLLHDRPKHTLAYRWLGLYPLYLLAEVAIIATDLAELLGSAIALCMLFPQLQLWHGVLLTAFDVFIILALGDPLRGKPVKAFELLVALLVLIVLICMSIIIAEIQPNWGDAFQGYIPSKHIFQQGGLYTSVGIIGATIMPHSLFLGSALATQDRISYRKNAAAAEEAARLACIGTSDPEEDKLSTAPDERSDNTSRRGGLRQYLREAKKGILIQFRIPPPSTHSTKAKLHSERGNNPLPFVKGHIYHGIVDVVISLLGFALVINSMITILAAAVFFYGKEGSNHTSPASLFDAYDLISDLLGLHAAKLFAVALLAAGQSSSILATVSGQAVAEGYLHWRVSPVMRRLATRLLAIIPSIAVAIGAGRHGIDTLLVASQVVLCITLPFITFPLLYCTSSKSIMRVRVPPPSPTITLEPPNSQTATMEESLNDAIIINSRSPTDLTSPTIAQLERGTKQEEFVDFSNSILITIIGGAVWLVIVAANLYAIIDLARA